jgi:hypothetical protein
MLMNNFSKYVLTVAVTVSLISAAREDADRSDREAVATDIAQLLLTPIFSDGLRLWNISIVDSKGIPHTAIRVMSAPDEVSNAVCQTEIAIYYFDETRSDWAEQSRRQGIRVTDAVNACDYSLDPNSFLPITGDFLEATVFLEMYNQLLEEQTTFGKLIPEGNAWMSGIAEIVYDKNEATISVRFLVNGCILQVSFELSESGHVSMKSYSKDDVYCVRK